MAEKIKDKLIKKYGQKNGIVGASFESFELPTIKTDRVERIMLEKFFMPNSESYYSGFYQIKISYQKPREKETRKLVEIPLDFLNIKEEEILNNSINDYVDELVNFEEYQFVLNINSRKFEFVIITTDNCFLMVDLNKAKRAVKNFRMELKFERDRVLKETVLKKTKSLIRSYLLWQYENRKNEFYEYPRYLSEKFRPFQRFLESERKSITNEEYKPKANYSDIEFKKLKQIEKEELINTDINEEMISEEAIIRFDDFIPRQLRERRNLIKVVWNEQALGIDKENKKKKIEKNVIVKVEDWDDEELALIFSKPEAVNKLKKAMKKGKIILKENL
ncbi:MAG: hypothetical protein ACTSQG_10565, partial [Promethearchaeota archaeon]